MDHTTQPRVCLHADAYTEESVAEQLRQEAENRRGNLPKTTGRKRGRLTELWLDAISDTYQEARCRVLISTVWRLPVVVVKRQTLRDAQLNAFQLGVDVGRREGVHTS